MKKILLTMLVIAFLACPAMAQRYRQHTVQIVDELGDAVTNITSITVFNSGLSSSPTIYSDRAGTLTITNPLTTSSDNSTFDQATGSFRWFQTKPNFKLTITDGTKVLTIDAMDEGDTRFPWYANYIGTAASLSVNDNQSIIVGTDSDMVLSWTNASDFMSWVPSSDGAAYNLGTSGTAKNVDFNWFVGTALGIKGDEGNATLDIDGVDITLNENTNKTTGINNGTSTGAITIGSTTSGTLAFDTTSGITMNADDSIAVTTSAGTIDIDSTGGDLGIDATDKSILIDSGEAAADDAIIIVTTGAGSGMQITSLADIDITTTGASGEDITIDNQGGSVNIIATENISSAILIEADGGILEGITLHADQGTGDESIFLSSDVGGITLNAADSSVDIEAPDAASGDIALSAGDDMTLTSTGLMTLAHSESLAIGQVHSSKYVTVYAAHASLSAAQSGGVFVTTAGGGSQFFQLPAASAGLIYYFVDISATAADDLMVKPTAGDSVADAAVSKMYASVGDEINTGLTVVAVNSGSWSVISSNGTWTPTQLP